MTQSFDEWFEKEDPFCGNEKNKDAIWAKKFMRPSYNAGAQSRQAEIDELQKRINEALEAIESESSNYWGLWKEKGDMYEQGASNAYEKSYWILKGVENEE